MLFTFYFTKNPKKMCHGFHVEKKRFNIDTNKNI